jgi:hypothetical protein
MKDVTNSNFGLLIAYLLPGFTALWGVSFFSSTVRHWLSTSTAQAPTLGGFLYGTIGAVAAGLTVSTVRWLLIDTLHRLTGLRPTERNYSQLQNNIEAFEVTVAHQYRYYQFYANMCVAMAFTYAAWLIAHGWPGIIPTAAITLAELLFWIGSRDTLRNYHQRLAALLG